MQVPRLGLGLYKVPRADVRELVARALAIGYRLFDTARSYTNEVDLAEALEDVLTDEHIVIETKIGPKEQGSEAALTAIGSIKSLFSKFLERGDDLLVLVHWPGATGLKPADPANRRLRNETWRALCRESVGTLKIGVSNYTKRHLEEMLEDLGEDPCFINPCINQIEASPLFWKSQEECIELCQALGIAVQAYSPLAQCDPRLLSNDVIVEVARRHSATPAQVCLAWALHHNLAVVVKSASEARLFENWQAQNVKLSLEEMLRLDNLGIETKTCWDPTSIA